MIKVGILGAGYIAEAHAHGYASVPQAKVVLVVDPNLDKARRLAGLYQADAAEDLQAMLAADVDMVSICTPTPTHAALACALMRAGKHVLCEKPIARTLAEADAMIALAGESGVKLMIAHVSRYEVDHLKAREVLERGDIGPLRMAYHAIVGPYPGWSTGDWLGDRERSGGPVVDLAIHSVDYLLWLFNSPAARVYALGNRKGPGRDHYVLVNLQFENGGLALIEASWAHPQGSPLVCRAELCGEHGRISWDYSRIDGLQTWLVGSGPQSAVMEGENSFAAQIEDFIRCIENDLPSPIPGSAGREALRVCLAALESLESGRSVALSRT